MNIMTDCDSGIVKLEEKTRLFRIKPKHFVLAWLFLLSFVKIF